MKFKCSYSKLVDLHKLTENPKNPNKHPNKQIDMLAKIIDYQGQRCPIVVSNLSGFIVKGHARLMALKKLKWTQAAVDYQDYENEAMEYADMIADNKIAEFAEHNDDMMKKDLEKLNWDLDIELLGLEDLNLDPEIFENEDNSNLNKEDINDSNVIDKLKKANMIVVEELSKYLDNKEHDILHPDVTIGNAVINFIHSLHYNKEYYRYNSIAFCKEQFETAGDTNSIKELIKKTSNKDSKIDRIMFFCQNNTTLKKLLSTGIATDGCRLPMDFPAVLAKDLINEFCVDKGSVLDPCHGWGGRSVGFLLSKATNYTGVDPSKHAHKAVGKIKKTLVPFCDDEKNITLIKKPFEKTTLKDKFDFALTSPPYFDVEKYEGKDSARHYENFEVWCDKFYEPLLKITHGILKNNTYFILQIGSQRYPLKDVGIKLAKKVGFKYIDFRSTNINRTGSKATELENSEICLIFKKE